MAFRFYSRANLLSIISSIHHIPPIDNATWRVLKDNGIVKTITRRGCRAGLAIQRSKLRSCEGSSTLQASRLSSYENSFCTNTEIQDDLELHLHNTSLNIHANTLARNAVHSTVVNYLQVPSRDGVRVSGPDRSDQSPQRSVFYTPKIMVSNVMSLVPKLVEVQEFLLRTQVDLAFITETWLKTTIANTVVDIPGYSIIRRDRMSNDHGGVCLYITENGSRFKQLRELSCCDDHEVLWVQLRPNRLPRGFSSLIVAVVYHPHWAETENSSMREHLFRSLSLAESKCPNCALIVAGDFNRLGIKSLKKHFRLKQIVKKPTRKDAILDLILTNLHDFYDDPRHFPPFGLSDHNTIAAEPRTRVSSRSTKYVFKRDMRASRKAEMGRFLSGMDWPSLFTSFESCEDMLSMFCETIHAGLDLLIPVKKVRVCSSDAPWMTQHLKSLILKRQKAFHNKGPKSLQYKLYRNVVNRERKVCKANFYKLKVENMKEKNPMVWWKEVKRLCGAQQHSSDLISQIHAHDVQELSPNDLTNAINDAFLEPLQEYRLHQPLTRLPTDEISSKFHDTSDLRIHKLLSKLNPSKASGPDDIPNWLLREYADLLAYPVSKIISASFVEQRLPHMWKLANVSPLQKKKPVNDLKKDIRPISLTSCLSKVAEDCIVADYVKPAVLKVLDPNQYGAKSSTTQALIDMVHNWAKGTDGNGETARVILSTTEKLLIS